MSEQLTFVLRDAGMEIAAEAQELKLPGWKRQAVAAIESVARRSSHVHVDDVARYCEGWLPEPSHPNAWGAVWLEAIRRGFITRTGEVKPAGGSYRLHAHKHGRAYPVYRSNLFPRNDGVVA